MALFFAVLSQICHFSLMLFSAIPHAQLGVGDSCTTVGRLTSKHTLEVTFQASKSGCGYQSIDQDFLANNRAEIDQTAL